MTVPEACLITGATGTLGRELVSHLIGHSQATLHLIVRQEGCQPVQERVQRLFSGCGLPQSALEKRVSVVAGDIERPEMAIPRQEFERFQSRITHFFHLAALTDLNGNEASCRRINLEGTQEAVRLAGKLPRLQRFVYFSTAFVVGSRHDGLSLEDTLPSRPGHANSYEASKYAAEHFVRERMKKGSLPATIFRPSIVVGDSTEGEISTFRVIYPFIELFARGHLTSFPSRPETPVHVVPVDFVVQAAVAIARLPDSQSKTYHLVSRNPPPVALFLRMLRELVPSAAAIEIIDPERFEEKKLSPSERLVFQSIRPYLGYLNRTINFDTRNLEDALGRLGLPFPDTGEAFVRNICRYRLSKAAERPTSISRTQTLEEREPASQDLVVDPHKSGA